MDRLCSRCIRLQVVLDCNARYVLSRATIRSFSSTRTTREEGDAAKPASRPNPVTQAGRSLADAVRGSPPSRPAGILIRRQPNARPLNDTQSGEGSQNRPLLRRVGGPAGGNASAAGGVGAPQGRPRPILRRTVDGKPQPGQLLRRVGDFGADGTPIRRPARGPPGAASQAQGRQPQQGQQKTRRRRAVNDNAKEDEDEEATEAEVDDYMTKFIARPDNPTEQITYNPKTQTMTELQKDWPNTPLSSTGLTASLVQKIEWLARRLPHGYQTPEQIAEHYHKGNFTRFESQEEKDMVIKIAQELAQKKANQQMDNKSEQTDAEDMSVADVTSNAGDKNSLVGSIVKGDYAGLEKQRMPFLNNIARTLRNNETYGSVETSKFMAKIQSVMPAQGQRRVASQKSA